MPSSGRFGVFLRGISPPAGGEFLCPRRQRNQNAAGDGSDEHFVLIVAFPRTPFTGVTPWGGQNPSGARNQECLGAVPSGPTGGLCFEKIEAAAVPRLRLGFRTNAPGPFSAVGAHSVRPRAGLGPAPTGPYFVGAAHWAARNTSRERTRLRRKNESTSGHTAGTGVLTRPQDRTGSFPHRQAPIFQPANFFPHTPEAAHTAPGTPFSVPPAVLSSGHRRNG